MWCGLFSGGRKAPTGGRASGSEEMRRGSKRCSSLTPMKLIFTPFNKINEILCGGVFFHQSRYKLLLLIVKFCGVVMQGLLEMELLLFLAVDTHRTVYFLLLILNNLLQVSAKTFWSLYLPFFHAFRMSLVLSTIPVTRFLSEREFPAVLFYKQQAIKCSCLS